MRTESTNALIMAEPAAAHAVRPPLVVDCSVLAAVLFDEANRDQAAEALGGRDLHAPDLIDHELVSVAVKKARLGLGEVAHQALMDLAELALTRCQVDASTQLDLAVRYDLTAYDAAYLALADALRAPLVTYDLRLGDAAHRHFGRR
jgi:predicted nucleic acid-binding protein